MDLLTSILVRRSSLGTSINLTRFRGIKMDEVFTPYARTTERKVTIFDEPCALRSLEPIAQE